MDVSSQPSHLFGFGYWLYLNIILVLMFGAVMIYLGEATHKASKLIEKHEHDGLIVKGSSLMGIIEPLPNLKLEMEEPRKLYKFSSKFSLSTRLQKTNINFITQIDKQYASRLAERQKIIDTHPHALKCLPSAVPLVHELYNFLVTEYLPHRYPTIFTLAPDRLLNHVTRQAMPLTPPNDPTEVLFLLAINIDEDFLMFVPSPDGEGYSLHSFIWCYPVGFDPKDKPGFKAQDVFGIVPGNKKKSQDRNDRCFETLEVGKVVCKVKWTLAANDSLYEHPKVPTHTKIDISNLWVRCELQTLFTLPKTGGKIISTHLYLYALQEIKSEGYGEELRKAIDGIEMVNAPDFRRNKREPPWQEKVKEFLRS